MKFTKELEHKTKALQRVLFGEQDQTLWFSKVMIGEKQYHVFAPKGDSYLESVGPVFEPLMVKVFMSLLRRDFYCLDIGANIGITTILFSENCKHVDSFEPSPTTFDVLKRNIRASRLKNASPINVGLGAENMQSSLAYAPDNRSGGFVANLTSPAKSHTVETIQIRKLDDMYLLKQEQKIDFIKIDVEGFEKRVLEGGSRLVAEHKPIVVLELNHWCLNAFQRISVPDFFDYLRSIFPFLYAINSNGTYADLHNESESFMVMYEHIIHFNYSNLIGAFNDTQLFEYKDAFTKYPEG